MHLLRILLDGFGILLLVTAFPLMAELLLLSLAAILPRRHPFEDSGLALRLAVIVPAHNEEKLITACVESLRANNYPATIYVVAHNCTDSTSASAVAAGATSLELEESSGHGKGVALDYGFKHALAAGAEAVLVIDADSVVSSNLFARVAAAYHSGSHATQCRYIAANAAATNRTRLMSLALLGFNVVRPQGRSRLGLSCGIFGNGFALSAATLQRVPYAAHSIVEDLEYHLLLLRAGLRVDYLDDATVYGEMPVASAAASTQRARWEGGRMMMRRRFTLPLLTKVLKGRLQFAEPLADLLSVPIATGAVLLLVDLIVPSNAIRLGALCGIAILAFHTLVTAFLTDEPMQNLKALATAPLYVAFKIALLPRTWRAARKDAAWVRTERNDSNIQ